MSSLSHNDSKHGGRSSLKGVWVSWNESSSTRAKIWKTLLYSNSLDFVELFQKTKFIQWQFGFRSCLSVPMQGRIHTCLFLGSKPTTFLRSSSILHPYIRTPLQTSWSYKLIKIIKFSDFHAKFDNFLEPSAYKDNQLTSGRNLDVRWSGRCRASSWRSLPALSVRFYQSRGLMNSPYSSPMQTFK